MINAVDVLIADHRMIRKLLGHIDRANHRLNILSESLIRVVKSHAWFENNVFIPAFKREKLLEKKFVQEIISEHDDIEFLMTSFLKTPIDQKDLWEARFRQFKALMDGHFLKEEDGLFPICAQVMTSKELGALAEEMRRRQPDVLRIL